MSTLGSGIEFNEETHFKRKHILLYKIKSNLLISICDRNLHRTQITFGKDLSALYKIESSLLN